MKIKKRTILIATALVAIIFIVVCYFLFIYPSRNLSINNPSDDLVCVGDCLLKNGVFEKFGMLSIRQPDQGCIGSCSNGTKYRLSELAVQDNGEYRNESIILKSPDIPDVYDQLMVKLYGKINKDGIEDDNFKSRKYDLMTVKGYKLLSKVKYHTFLRDEKGRYTKEKYGCKIGWNSTFGWEYLNGNPIIKAKLTSNKESNNPGKFIELFYDGNTSKFIREVNNLGWTDPCKIHLR